MNRFTTALALLPLLCSTPVWATTFVYVSNAESGTVFRYALNEATGRLHWRGDTPAGKRLCRWRPVPMASTSMARCAARLRPSSAGA